MKHSQPRIAKSASFVVGLLLASVVANASVTIPPSQDPSSVCTGEPGRDCPNGTKYSSPSCGSITIQNRQGGYCCQKYIAQCIGSGSGWVYAAVASYGSTCGSDGRCRDASGDPIPEPNPGTPTAM